MNKKRSAKKMPVTKFFACLLVMEFFLSLHVYAITETENNLINKGFFNFPAHILTVKDFPLFGIFSLSLRPSKFSLEGANRSFFSSLGVIFSKFSLQTVPIYGQIAHVSALGK